MSGSSDGMTRWSRRRLVATAAAVAIGTVGLAVSAVVAPGLPAEGGTGREVPAADAPVPAVPAPAPHFVVRRTVVAPAPDVPPQSLIATLAAATPYRADPSGPETGTVAATNPFGAPTVLGVIGEPVAVAGVPWLHVELPIRPNGSTGWIPAAGVTVTRTSYRVAVDRATRTLTVTDAGHIVLTTPVAVGTPATPTPADSTYLWELIRPDDPEGAYGPYIFGLAEFSDTYATFNGGNAQIGIHGQDEPWSIGQAASHGCVRLPNDEITRLASMLPLGTPVTIS